jgi:hypothetical protein
MPELRKDENYRARDLRSFFGGFGLFVLLLAVCALSILFLGSRHPEIVIAVILASFLVAAVRTVCALNPYNHCPECGAKLPALKKEASTRYGHRFLCKRCDILWTTDVFDDD